MAGLVEISVRTPMSMARSAIRFVPTSRPSSANTELSELAVADRSEATPVRVLVVVTTNFSPFEFGTGKIFCSDV